MICGVCIGCASDSDMLLDVSWPVDFVLLLDLSPSATYKSVSMLDVAGLDPSRCLFID